MTIVYNFSLLYIKLSYLLAAKRLILAGFRIILSIITSIVALRILCRKISLGESNIWYKSNDISSLISITYFIFLNISPKLNHVYISIYELALVLLLLETEILFLFTKRFWNTIAGLCHISLIAC